MLRRELTFVSALLLASLGCLVRAQSPFLPPGNPMIDRSSFIVISGSREQFEAGAIRLFAGDFAGALESFRESWDLYRTDITAELIVFCLESLASRGDNRVQVTPEDIQWWKSAGNAIAAVETPRERLFRSSRLMKMQGNLQTAVGILRSYVDSHPDDISLLFHMGCMLKDLGSTAEAAMMFEGALRGLPSFVKARLNVAAMYHSFNDLDRAIEEYRNLLASPNIADSGRLSMMARSNLAAIYYLKKMAWEAIAELKTLTATVMDRLITDCSTFSSDNYCLAHESWQRAWMVLNLLNNTVESSSNAGVVCVESDVAVLSADCAHHVDFIGIGLMHLIIFQRSVCDWEGLEIITMGFLVPETLRTYDQLMADKITVPDGNYISGPTLPFESLLMPVELKKRLRIAKIRGYSVERKAEVINLDRRVIPSQCSFLRLPQRPQDCDLTSSFSSSGQSSKRLVLGYLSYDFNEHPTAHLVEALFYIAKSCRVGSGNPFCDALKHGSGSDNIFNHIENIAFNYGSVAESEYRDRLKSSADKFFDLAVQPHETSANFIAGNQVDILLDMQLYTQGNRAELVASRPAPIVVNYLVYPGTSGSKAHDYIVVDRVVVPPEHSQHYSERLLLLPPSYQVSIYDHLEGMPEFNEKDNIHRPSDSILKICNFNKIDKLDPLSFRMWIQILRRVPQSRLYLLDPNRPEDIEDVPEGSGPGPNEMAKHNLIQELRAEGLNYDPENSQSVSSRMEFYPRVSKVEHVRRQSEMDLFVDTLVYGAHSTATDALRANLPVLTIEGDSFPNRVGVSLYESFCDARPYVNNTTRLTETQGSDRACRTACQDPDLLRSILAPQSLKAFEDTAVLLLSKPNLLRKLKEQIALHVRCKHGIFSSFSSSLHFFHGMDAISDVYALYNKDGGSERRQLAHVAVSNMVTLES